jgi:hypothetical protein
VFHVQLTNPKTDNLNYDTKYFHFMHVGIGIGGYLMSTMTALLADENYAARFVDV